MTNFYKILSISIWLNFSFATIADVGNPLEEFDTFHNGSPDANLTIFTLDGSNSQAAVTYEWTQVSSGPYIEQFSDINSNGVWDSAEEFTDSNGNGQYDIGEDFNDYNNNGQWDNENLAVVSFKSAVGYNENPKRYKFKLTITNANNQSVSDSKIVIINPEPNTPPSITIQNFIYSAFGQFWKF